MRETGKMTMQVRTPGIENILEQMIALAGESPIYAKLAYYIEKNYLKIIFMTANDTAAEAGVSQGSVSRFCSSLGFRGYNDFVRYLQKNVSEDISTPQRLKYAAGGHRDPVDHTLALEIKNLEELGAVMQSEAYAAAQRKIIDAPRLTLLSARLSATLLPYMSYALHKMRNGVETVTPGGADWDLLSLRDPAETEVIAIAFPRYAGVLVDKLRELHEGGFSVTLITDSRLSPAAEYAQNILLVPVTTSSVFDVYSTPMALINLLLRDAAAQMPGLEQRLNRLEAYETTRQVYRRKPGRPPNA